MAGIMLMALDFESIWKQDANTHTQKHLWHLAAFFAKGVLVKQIFRHSILRSPYAPQVGHPVCQFFDGLHLLIQEMRLKEIAQLKQKINSLEKIRTQFHWEQGNLSINTGT